MTTQVSDEVLFRGEPYSLAGIAGSGLFDPAPHGLEPVSPSTACWRGYVASYAIEGDRLLLAALEISLTEAQARPLLGPTPLLGRRPVTVQVWGQPGDRCGTLGYRDLGTVAFSGGLLLAAGFLGGLSAHMGFHPAWKYERVVELLLEGGRVLAAFDRSASVAAMRARTLPGGVCVRCGATAHTVVDHDDPFAPPPPPGGIARGGCPCCGTMLTPPNPARPPSEAEVAGWIASTFERDYRLGMGSGLG